MTPSAWMDRLSDGVGFYYPGGRFLGPRHPVKISLLMGLLGFSSGWLTMIVAEVLGKLFPDMDYQEWPIFLTAGVVLSLVVAIPWQLWLGMRIRWAPVLFVYVVMANALVFLVIEQDAGHEFFGLFLYGFLTGTYLALAGSAVTQRVRPIWLVSTAIISGCSICSFLLIKGDPLMRQLPQEVRLPLTIAWFFTLINTPMAVCLGYLRWDWTPLPRQEIDSDQGDMGEF